MMTGAPCHLGKWHGEPVSETAPEAPPRAASGSVFTRQLGPIPVWAWLGIGLAIALAYYYWKQHTAATAATTASTSTPASDIPQFVNQVYTQSYPPTPNPPPVKKQDVTLPNYVGRPQEESLLKLQKIGLTGKGQPPVKGKTRIITAQDPKPGSQVAAGTVVTFKTKLT